MPRQPALKLCQIHSRGVTPDMPPFYEPGCPRCEQKRERGLVTGTEPSAAAIGRHMWGKNRDEFFRLSRAFRRAAANRARAMKLARSEHAR